MINQVKLLAAVLAGWISRQVRQAVRQCIIDAGNGGGYLLSSSNSIHSSCKAENLKAMVEAALEFGSYPFIHWILLQTIESPS